MVDNVVHVYGYVDACCEDGECYVLANFFLVPPPKDGVLVFIVW